MTNDKYSMQKRILKRGKRLMNKYPKYYNTFLRKKILNCGAKPTGAHERKLNIEPSLPFRNPLSLRPNPFDASTIQFRTISRPVTHVTENIYRKRSLQRTSHNNKIKTQQHGNIVVSPEVDNNMMTA